MAKQEVFSIYTVTERDGKQYREFPEGSGQQAIMSLRALYPKLTKFVLEGYEIDGNFRRADLRTYNRAR